MGSLVQRVVVFIRKVKLSKRNVRTIEGLPGGAEVKNLPASAGDVGSIPGSGRSPGEGDGYPPTPVFLPGKFHGWRSLADYSPWGCKESDMT